MDLIETIVLVGHVLFATAVIGLVLIQHGKGAGVGASFGAGASQTIFGAKGSGSFLTRMTSGLAVAFFVTSFALAVFAKQRAERSEDIGIPVPAAVESRAQPAPGSLEGVEMDGSSPVLDSSPRTEGDGSAGSAGEAPLQVEPSTTETQPDLE